MLEEIRDLACDHDLFVMSDEIYEKIIYGQEHISIGSLPGMEERTITINGFSKAYAMTGWRLGYLTGPRTITKWVTRLLSHSVSQATTFVQRAGVAALRGPQDEVQAMVREFEARRDLLVSGLQDLGIICSLPGGAFYVFPRCLGARRRGCVYGATLEGCFDCSHSRIGLWAWRSRLCATVLCHLSESVDRGFRENKEDFELR